MPLSKKDELRKQYRTRNPNSEYVKELNSLKYAFVGQDKIKGRLDFGFSQLTDTSVWSPSYGETGEYQNGTCFALVCLWLRHKLNHRPDAEFYRWITGQGNLTKPGENTNWDYKQAAESLMARQEFMAYAKKVRELTLVRDPACDTFMDRLKEVEYPSKTMGTRSVISLDPNYHSRYNGLPLTEEDFNQESSKVLISFAGYPNAKEIVEGESEYGSPINYRLKSITYKEYLEMHFLKMKFTKDAAHKIDPESTRYAHLIKPPNYTIEDGQLAYSTIRVLKAYFEGKFTDNSTSRFMIAELGLDSPDGSGHSIGLCIEKRPTNSANCCGSGEKLIFMLFDPNYGVFYLKSFAAVADFLNKLWKIYYKHRSEATLYMFMEKNNGATSM